MARLAKKSNRRLVKTPGRILSRSQDKQIVPKITIIDYDEASFQEKEAKTPEECFPFKDKPTVSWLNIDSVYTPEVTEKIGKCFSLHSLTLEDIATIGQRPKYEDFEDYLFIVLNMLVYDDKKGQVEAEQVSLVLGRNFVISFQEKEGDVFDPIRERIRSAKGRIRKMGPDYLAYCLIDAVVDHYFLILEKIGERIEEMEEELVINPIPSTLQIIHNLKKETIFLRKSVWPLREVIGGIERSESALIQQSTNIFLRDLYEHTIQVIDSVETFRDMISGMLDIYLSSVSNRMNEIMKVLTIIATIFIPLTFVVGIYGMNFNPQASPFNMPELNWRYGYLFTWCIMLAIVTSMVAYFKRKKWL